MNEIVNLEQDDEKLEKYQAESLIGQLGVVQLHLEDMYTGKEVALCISCLENKHLPTIEVLANECLGICRIQPLWKDIAHFAKDLRENKLISEYIGKDNDKTMKLRNQARDFRKKLGELLSSQKKANSSGEDKMIEKRGVEAPDLGELASIDNPGKTKTKVTKKKTNVWPWLIGLGAIGGLLYLNKKKKEKALALASQTQLAQTQTQQQRNVNTQEQPSGDEDNAEARLLGMGINTARPGVYQTGESYKELK